MIKRIISDWKGRILTGKIRNGKVQISKEKLEIDGLYSIH